MSGKWGGTEVSSSQVSEVINIHDKYLMHVNPATNKAGFLRVDVRRGITKTSFLLNGAMPVTMLERFAASLRGIDISPKEVCSAVIFIPSTCRALTLFRTRLTLMLTGTLTVLLVYSF